MICTAEKQGRGRAHRLIALVLAGAIGLGLGAATMPRLNIGRDQRQELLQADRDFDEATARDGAAGWASCFADDGIMMPAGGEMAVGKEAIRKYAEGMFTPDLVLRWEPMDARVSGNLGYTYGVYKATRVEGGGKTTSTYGKYVTVWHKLGRTWKVAVDVGNSSPAPKGK